MEPVGVGGSYVLRFALSSAALCSASRAGGLFPLCCSKSYALVPKKRPSFLDLLRKWTNFVRHPF